MSIKALLTRILNFVSSTYYDYTAGIITAGSGFTISSQGIVQTGNVVKVRFRLQKSDSTAFTQGRTSSVCTVSSNYAPYGVECSVITPASNAIGSYMNRYCAFCINTDGTCYVDAHNASDIKMIYVHAVYVIK